MTQKKWQSGQEGDIVGQSPRGQTIPCEGDGGTFSQSWFPICTSEEVATGAIAGFDFLDGRVVVVRGADGAAQVLSAYCPHLGADLAVGTMIDGQIRCAFHHWRFSAQGACVATGCGDPAPLAARLFAFPTQERHGLVWAFNGTTAHFDIPAFPFAADTLLTRVEAFESIIHADPWIICCNTPDMQHLRVVHGIEFDGGLPHDAVEWSDHAMYYDVAGRHRSGQKIDFRVGIVGTSIYYQEGWIDGRWFGFIAPFGMPRPGQTKAYMVVAVQRDAADPDAAAAFLDQVLALERAVVFEDIPILESARFRPGTLTRSDKSLARFFAYLRDFPRGHAAGDAMR